MTAPDPSRTAIVGKRLTLLLMARTESGGDEGAVYAGTVVEELDTLYLDQGSGTPLFEIRNEWIERIRPVSDDTRATLLDADYCLPLSVGTLPDDDGGSGLIPTGIRWPQ